MKTFKARRHQFFCLWKCKLIKKNSCEVFFLLFSFIFISFQFQSVMKKSNWGGKRRIIIQRRQKKWRTFSKKLSSFQVVFFSSGPRQFFLFPRISSTRLAPNMAMPISRRGPRTSAPRRSVSRPPSSSSPGNTPASMWVADSWYLTTLAQMTH